MAEATAERDGDTLWVQGDLDFDSVAALWNATESLFADDPPARIDLQGVSRANSSGVGLLVAWLGLVQRRQQTVLFVNVPAQMRAIIEVADLDAVLPLA
ncbi:MAG: anti-sigma-factor antagonist [Proteobacteria bacterium]|jgi:phospholipid transport system transporter-binding protein|nr:anti-sigma-factor antagonist [Pseudomonadota bacterium]MBS1225534.1 anti-sigma-factor antagonist [Pseudomonadota bacterium]MBS1248055.1 anti-sigma-factor antagonist [Pseudomonadota bacterium]MCU0809336.1 STAS domain-containing protein [Candidatus Contendobacter sp.]